MKSLFLLYFDIVQIEAGYSCINFLKKEKLEQEVKSRKVQICEWRLKEKISECLL